MNFKNWISFNKKNILLMLNLSVIVLTTTLSSLAFAKFNKADIVKKAVKATNNFESAAGLKNYYLAQALNDKEAKEIETIYFELFGKSPALQKVNIINDTVYSNGVSTQIVMKIQPKGLQLKKGSVVVNLHSKDTMLTYLKKLKTLYGLKSSTTKTGLIQFLIPEAFANDKNSGIGFVLWHALTRPAEPRVQVDDTCDEGGIFGYFTKPLDPVKCSHISKIENPRKYNPETCSYVDKGIRDSLLKDFMGTDIQKINRLSKVDAGFNMPYGLDDNSKAYKNNAKTWLNKIKNTPKLRSLKCDLSEWPKVTAYFTRFKTDDVKLTSEPHDYKDSMYMSSPKRDVKTETKDDGSTFEIFSDGTQIQTHKDGSKVYILRDGSRIPASRILSHNMITRDDGSKMLDLTYRTSKVKAELFGTGLTGPYRSYFYGGTMDSRPSVLISQECVQYTESILHDLSSSTTEACKYLAAHPDENFGIKVIPPKSGSVDVNIDSSSADAIE